ncbi:MAG: ABC transporter ATP-binding protein [Candidatus Riflebacteria bacterium]|nr:ABC transporter ATP-binding protein [Candidatus Riflebacteria bacterium]
MNENLLEVKNLTKEFLVEKNFKTRILNALGKKEPEKILAIDDVSFNLRKGEILGVLGESGSGKSTLAKILMGIYKADKGQLLYNGKDITTGKRSLSLLREMQMIFQDPYSSLNPRMTVKQIISEPLRIHGLYSKKDSQPFLVDALEEVGLQEDVLNKYPAEFSGGQRQRICICRSMILNPSLIIADEAVSALDVSVQAQILELLVELKSKRGLSMIFISHDVAVVRQIADRVLVFQKGQLKSKINPEDLVRAHGDEYTRKLIESAIYLREGKRFD